MDKFGSRWTKRFIDSNKEPPERLVFLPRLWKPPPPSPSPSRHHSPASDSQSILRSFGEAKMVDLELVGINGESFPVHVPLWSRGYEIRRMVSDRTMAKPGGAQEFGGRTWTYLVSLYIYIIPYIEIKGQTF